MSDMKKERLDKYLSHHGIGSRRHLKELIKKHTVIINGQQVTDASMRIDPQKDIISFDNTILQTRQFEYYLLNKPIGVISTRADYLERPTVVSLIPTTERIYPIGRLDKDTHGLLLLTNDGELTHKLIHPKYHISKTYRLIVAQPPTPEQLKALRNGVLLRDGITRPAEVIVKKQDPQQTILTMIIHEGKNRQIRRMCQTVGLILLDLQRIQFGPLTLDTLQPGEYRELTAEEVQTLHDLTSKK